MRTFREIFLLELRALVRSKTLAMLTVAGVLWVWLFPWLAKDDGTTAGARELDIHYSLAGVFALTVVALLASATGALARERQARRLQLTLVRPVRYVALVLAKVLAIVTVGAVVLAAACGTLALRADLGVRCNHVLSPVLPSPREEALTMYDAYIGDPMTPDAVKKAKKDVVLRLLEQRAFDHYQTIVTNAEVSWQFDLQDAGARAGEREMSARLRFSNQYDMRQDVVGDFTFGGTATSVSNITKAVLTIPLNPPALDSGSPTLSFFNRGRNVLMLRPRKDVHLLIPADAFGWNLVRTLVALVALLALIVSFGLFLSAGLGRSVAIFVAFVTLIVSEMSPSVVDQYADGLETDPVDRVGLAISRFAMKVTRPLSVAAPIGALAKDECVELRDLLRLVAADAVAIPLFLSLLTAFLLPRKQDE